MRTSFSRKEHTDSGLALVLLCLLAWFIFDVQKALPVALVATLAVMVYAPLIFPFTFLWLNISHFLGKIVSSVLLSVIFLVFVVPVAFFRKLAGKDTLKLKQFKKSDTSVFINRQHVYTAKDIEHPY